MNHHIDKGADGVRPHSVEQYIPREHRIFVNRNLKMDSIRWVGFDMDHTLALYNRNFIEALAFDLARRTLVEAKGYPEALLDVRYDPDFGIRGLVVDKEEGNILKMDKFHYVSIAYHGKRSLDRLRRKELYTSRPLQLSSSRFWSSDTLFGLPEIALYASVVEALENGLGDGGKLDFRQLFDDIRYSVDLIHKDGSLKRVIRERKGECFLRDPWLLPTLEKFRAEGKKIFLLTNSDFEYSMDIMSWILEDQTRGRQWQEHFDLVVVDSAKPGFFIRRPRWKPLPDALDGVPVFSGGHFQALEQELGARGDEILYIGDHIFGDILRSKKACGWRTALIVEELDHEIRAIEANEELLEELDSLQTRNAEIVVNLGKVRNRLDELRARKLGDYKSLDQVQLDDLDLRIRELTAEEDKLDAELTAALLRIKDAEERAQRRFSPYWGPLCKVDRELSRFGDQIRDYACLYTSRVSNFLHYPAGKYFHSPTELLPHELR